MSDEREVDVVPRGILKKMCASLCMENHAYDKLCQYFLSRSLSIFGQARNTRETRPSRRLITRDGEEFSSSETADEK